MTGFHSATVIAEAIAKGFPGIDVQGAYVAMKKEASVSELRGLPLYRQYGYIPCDLHKESVSTALDYAYNDWAVSRVAEAAGARADAAVFPEEIVGVPKPIRSDDRIHATEVGFGRLGGSVRQQ